MRFWVVFISLAVAFSLVTAACDSGTYPAEEIDRVVARGPTASPISTESPTGTEWTPQTALSPTVHEDALATTPPPTVPVTATPAPGAETAVHVIRPFSLPTATVDERRANTGTWLYLSGFNAYTITVADPLSGHSLHEIPVRAQNPGMAVSRDGTRLYVLDMWWDRGEPAGKGELAIYDTVTWQVVHREPVDGPAFLLGGNPISLSGDGRWLTLAHHPKLDVSARATSVFDTQAMEFLPDTALQELTACTSPWLPPRLVGQPGHPRVYALCNEAVVALEAQTLSKAWQASAPSSARGPDLVLSPDGTRLYGLYPQVDIGCCSGTSMYVERTELLLSVWETESGNPERVVNLSDLVDVPDATIGRGDAAYIAMSPDGRRLYVLWENRLWDIDPNVLNAPSSTTDEVRELVLPAPADGLVTSVDGRELYILPSTAGVQPRRVRRGMWTVDTERFEIVRHASDWPELPAMAQVYAGPAQQ